MGTLYKKIILLTLLFFSTTLFASVAKVVALKGEATITREGTTISLDRKSTILKHDEIRTKENTKIQLLFKDETIVSIGKNSTFKVLDYLYDEKNNNHKVELNMIEGTFRTITGKIGKFAPKRFNLKTKSASIGIRGTQIVMSISPNEEKIFCTEGKIFVQKLDSKISSTVNAGEFVSFKPGEIKQKIDVKKIKKDDLKNINKSVRIQKNLAVDSISVKSEIENENDNTNKQTENTPTTNSAILSNEQNNEKTQVIDSEVRETTKVVKKEIEEEKKKQKEAAEKATRLAAEKAARLAAEKAARLAAEKAARLAAEKKAAAKQEALNKQNQITADNKTAENKAAIEEAKRLAEEKKAQAEADKAAATTAEEIAAAEEAIRLVEEELTKLNAVNLFKLTSEDFLKNNNSKVKYSGNFNNYTYNSKNQYLKKYLLPVQIPTNTTISMDIDFGVKKDHISNGKVVVSNTYKGYYDTTLEFDGKIKDAKKAEFELKGTNNTTGSGSGKFYGEEANAIKGEIDLEDNNSIGIKGSFDANKEGFDDEFFTIDDITPKSYFEDFDSVATYKGNFNNYNYDDKDQYIQYTSGNKEAIPTNTKISMDVDFGAINDHISNGKIEASGTSEVLTFDGHYHDNDAKFHIDPTGNTEGSRGEGHFYGPEADIMSGKVDFNSKTTDLAIKGTFDAKKQ